LSVENKPEFIDNIFLFFFKGCSTW